MSDVFIGSDAPTGHRQSCLTPRDVSRLPCATGRIQHVKVDIALLGQPWDDGANLDDFLAGVVEAGQPTVFQAAVAWGKRSGLTRVAPYFEAIRSAGGTVDLILGISEGGATRQGLEMALA